LEPLLLTIFADGRKSHSRQLSLHLDKCRINRSQASVKFVAENSIIEYPIRRTVLTWHLLTSGFSGT
jgi:hypothetical protein